MTVAVFGRGLRHEEWRPIAGFEGFYEVSSFGRVRSLLRKIGNRTFRGGVLSPVDDGKGYPKVVLRVRGAHRTFKLHRLVCIAFHGPPPDGHEAHHLDNDRWNSRADNLAWVTPSENNRAKPINGGRHFPKRVMDQARKRSWRFAFRSSRGAGV